MTLSEPSRSSWAVHILHTACVWPGSPTEHHRPQPHVLLTPALIPNNMLVMTPAIPPPICPLSATASALLPAIIIMVTRGLNLFLDGSTSGGARELSRLGPIL